MGFAPHDLVKAVLDGAIKLLLAVSAPVACYCSAEVITHCDTLCWSTSYYKAFNIVPCWTRGLAKQAPKSQIKYIITIVSVLLSSANPSRVLQNFFKFCFATLVWHSGWLAIDRIMWENAHTMQSKPFHILPPEVLCVQPSITNNSELAFVFHSCCLQSHPPLQNWKLHKDKKKKDDFPSNNPLFFLLFSKCDSFLALRWYIL